MILMRPTMNTYMQLLGPTMNTHTQMLIQMGELQMIWSTYDLAIFSITGVSSIW